MWVQARPQLLLPPLGGGRSGKGATGRSRDTKRGSSSPRRVPLSPPSVPSARGLVYPGPQPILSNPPRPDNRIQTILQPDLVKPPTVQVPLALPNLVVLARSPEVPPPPPAPPRPTPRPLPPPPLPESPQFRGDLQMPSLPLSVPAPPPPPPQVKVKLVLPPPTSDRAGPSPPNKERPKEPTPQASKQESPPPEPPKLVSLSDMGAVDARSLLVLSPIPAPPQEAPKVPPGEARGQFAMGPEPNLTASSQPGMDLESRTAVTSGVETRSESASSGGGSAPDSGAGGQLPEDRGLDGGYGGQNVGGGSGRGAGAGSGPARESTGDSSGGLGARAGSGSGTGRETASVPGEGSGSGLFPGITIADGKPDSSLAAPPDSRPAIRTPENSTYGLTIVGTGSSGGGLKDFGIFRNESVYTVYIEMNHSSTAAPAWILQYALLREAGADPHTAAPAIAPSNTIQMEAPLQPPFPITKEYPPLPAEIVSRNVGRMIVVYAVISPEGKMGEMRIIQSPHPLLNQPLLGTLRKWAFRPAETNGKPVAVKALLGIVLSAAP